MGAGASQIIYTTAYRPVTFSVSDFRSACSARGLGTLASVQFTTTPPSGAGRLYGQYSGFQTLNSEVRTQTRYFPDQSPELSQVTFVPRVGYQGTVTLNYTAADTQGRTIQGQVKVVVTPNTASSYFTDVSYSAGWRRRQWTSSMKTG